MLDANAKILKYCDGTKKEASINLASQVVYLAVILYNELHLLYSSLLSPLFSSLDEMLTNLFEFCAGIYQFALEGNALKAIELTEQLATNLLEKNKDLHFDLLSLHFVELVCARKW